MTDVRFCRDCRWMERGQKFPLCFNPHQPRFDLVHGSHPSCETARLDPSKLSPPNFQTRGPTGQWFEPKEAE